MDTYLLNEAGIMDTFKYLTDLGFAEIKPNLFIKEIRADIKLFVDYRQGERKIYAYDVDKVINHKAFKEFDAIMKIEKHIMTQNKGTLLGYVNA